MRHPTHVTTHSRDKIMKKTNLTIQLASHWTAGSVTYTDISHPMYYDSVIHGN